MILKHLIMMLLFNKCIMIIIYKNIKVINFFFIKKIQSICQGLAR